MRFLSVLAPRIEQLLAIVIDPTALIPPSFVQEKKQQLHMHFTRAPVFHLQQVKAKFLV